MEQLTAGRLCQQRQSVSERRAAACLTYTQAGGRTKKVSLANVMLSARLDAPHSRHYSRFPWSLFFLLKQRLKNVPLDPESNGGNECLLTGVEVIAIPESE